MRDDNLRFDPRVIAFLLIAVRVGAAMWAIGLSESSPRGAENDIVHYHGLAEAEGVPYQDFVVEWPPVGYAVIEALNARTPAAMTPRLAWLMFAVDVGTFAAIVIGWTIRAGLAYLILGTPLLPIIYLRLDLLAVFLAVLAAVLVKRSLERGAGIALAAAVLTKVWPLVLLPVFAARRKWTALGWGVASLAVATAAWIVVTSPDALGQVATVRGARGWEISTIIGSLYRLFDSGPLLYNQGAYRVGHAAVGIRLLLASAAALLVLLAIARGRKGRDERIVDVTVVAIVLVFMPQFMPQYIMWLVPWAAIATQVTRWFGMLTFGAVLLSFLLYLETEALADGSASAQMLLFGRNLLVLAIVIVGFFVLSRAEGTITDDRQSRP